MVIQQPLYIDQAVMARNINQIASNNELMISNTGCRWKGRAGGGVRLAEFVDGAESPVRA
ncbi:MAG: hypothetical protein MK179_00540 [Pirellulaceae bacterium]|nr:hypothetical protein [Pirellulaceae bacterium]